jgi:general secretion pathway protein G
VGQKGLTFVELLITVSILAVLASVIIPLSEMTVKREKELELRRNLRTIRAAIDDYKRAYDEGRILKKIGESGYPPDLMTLVEGVDDAKSPEGKTIRFLRRIPRDPLSPDKTLPPEEAWALRSYLSPPDDPREGEDVFDVFSKSEEIAIDGTPYSTW